MHVRIQITCGCIEQGPRCNHPFADKKGAEELPVPNQDRTIRVSRCALWPDHDPKLHPHSATLTVRTGPITLARPVDGDQSRLTGTCRRCGEVYNVRVDAAGLMRVPEPKVPERLAVASSADRQESDTVAGV